MKKGNGGFQVGLFRHRKTLNARNPVDWTVSWLNLGNVVQGLVLPPPLCLPTCQLWMTLRNLSSYRRPCSTINLSQSCIRVRSQCHILKKAYSGRCVVNIHSFLFFFIWFQKIVWWRDSSNNNTKRKKQIARTKCSDTWKWFRRDPSRRYRLESKRPRLPTVHATTTSVEVRLPAAGWNRISSSLNCPTTASFWSRSSKATNAIGSESRFSLSFLVFIFYLYFW